MSWCLNLNKITPNIFLLELPGPSSNAYVLVDGREAAIVDPGLCKQKELEAELGEAGVVLESISRVFLTHAHADHSSNARFFPHAQLLCSQETLNCLLQKSPTAMFLEFCVPFFSFKGTALADGAAVHLGGFKLRCVNTPGHTQDAACFFEEETKTLFSGDSLFTQGSVPRVFYPEGGTELLQSWQKLEKLGAALVAPGHGPVSKHVARELEESRQGIAQGFL